MSLKLCFKDKIHRISQAPVDFKVLTAVILATYPNQLPPSWELYYIDSEGDKISLSHEQDYKDFLRTNPNNPSMSLKVYIVPADGEPLNPSVAPLHVAQVDQEPRQQEEEKIEEQKIEEVPQKDEEKQDHSGENESRESSEELSDEISQQSDDIRQLTDSNITSQNKWEKAVKAERNSREERQPKKEVRPRAGPQPGNEGGNNRVLNQAKELLKRITRGDMSDAELMQALEKMDKLEESMTPEQKEELRKKKEDIERRRARRESRMANGDEECKVEANVESSQVSRGKKGNHRGSRREERKAEEKPEPMKGSRRGGDKLARPNKDDLKKEREKRTRANKVLRNLDKILAAVEKGDRKTVSKCRDRALEDLSEEEKKILEPVFEILDKGGNADTLRNAIKEAEGKLLGGSDQQELDDCDEKEEKLKNYSQEVREKALQMKEAFPNEDIDKLCEYVAESPEEMSVGELLSVYKP